MTDDDKALVERLRAGVPCCDPDAGNGEGSFFVEDADETMHEAADRIEALSAENKRLQFFVQTFARHRLEERAAIVAWLRQSPQFINSHGIADAIEAGEHLKWNI